MAKNQELEMVAENVATETKRWVKKPNTAEDVEILTKGVEIMNQNASENFKKVLASVVNWNAEDGEVKTTNRKDLVESFGETAELKNYLESEDFKSELSDYAAIAKVVPVINNIVSYNSRRTTTYVSKKKQQVIINGDPYTVNAAFFASTQHMSKAERREALLAHPDTVKNNDIEEF